MGDMEARGDNMEVGDKGRWGMRGRGQGEMGDEGGGDKGRWGMRGRGQGEMGDEGEGTRGDGG